MATIGIEPISLGFHSSAFTQISLVAYNGSGRIRTADTLLFRQVLYQLSYRTSLTTPTLTTTLALVLYLIFHVHL